MVRTDKACLELAQYLQLPQWKRVSQLNGLRHILWRKDAFCRTIGDTPAGLLHNLTARHSAVASASAADTNPDTDHDRIDRMHQTLHADISRHQFACWVYVRCAALSRPLPLSLN